MASAALLAAKCMGEFLAYHALGTVLFDVVHAFAHGLPRRALLSRWHSCHHKFQGTSLKVVVQLEADNVMYHLTPGWLTALVRAAAVAAAGTPLSWVQLTAIAYPDGALGHLCGGGPRHEAPRQQPRRAGAD